MDLIRTRQIILKLQRSLLSELINIQKEGLLTFYRGVFPSLLSIVPQSGLNFWLYSTINKLIPKEYPSIVAGIASGGLSKLAILPLDQVKRRCQVRRF